MAAIKDYESSNGEPFLSLRMTSTSLRQTSALNSLTLKFNKNKSIFEFCIISVKNAAHSSMEHAKYIFIMPYDFLHHLSCAPLPVRIYDTALIRKVHVYQSHGFLIAQHDDNQKSANESIAIIKITRTGRRMVRQHLKENESSQASADTKSNRLMNKSAP